MSLHALSYDRLVAVQIERHDPLTIVLAGVQPTAWPGCDAVRTAACLFPHADSSVRVDLEDSVFSAIRKIYTPFFTHRGIGGQLVALPEQCPVCSRRQNRTHAALNELLLRVSDGHLVDG